MQPSQPLDAETPAELDAILARHAGVPGDLMPVLQDIDAAYGYLPRRCWSTWRAAGRPAGRNSARGQLLRRFRFEPVGRHVVEVCTGTSCYARGSAALLERLEKELGIGPGRDRPRRAVHPADGPLPGAVRLVAGHEDRRPQLRPRQSRPRAGHLEQFA